MGFYNHTHSTSKHQSKSPRSYSRRATPGADTNESSPPPAPSLDTDSANLSAADESPSARPAAPDDTPIDANDFQFQGAFMHRHDEGALWMTSIGDNTDDADYLDEPLPPPSFTAVRDDAAAAVADGPAFLAAAQLALAHLSLKAADDGFELDTSLLQSRLEETAMGVPSDNLNPEASSAPVSASTALSPTVLALPPNPVSTAPNAAPPTAVPVSTIPALQPAQPGSTKSSTEWVNSATELIGSFLVVVVVVFTIGLIMMITRRVG